MQADKPNTSETTPETMRAQAASLRADFARYQALQLEAEEKLFALRAEPFAPRFEEAEREEAAKLEAFQVGARDCAARADKLEDEAHKLEAALAQEAVSARLASLYSQACALEASAELREQGKANGLSGSELRALARDVRSQAEALRTAAQPSELRADFRSSRIVRRVEVESFGVEHAQYFRGAGAEDFDEVALGVGSSEREALEDALDSLAQSGVWSFKPEHGFPSEPQAEDYSERDEVGEALEESRSDNVGSQPEPSFRVTLYPFNGSGPIILREGLSHVEANGYASDYCAKRESAAREAGDVLEVSDLTPETCETTGCALARFELQYEGSGVSDSEGIISAELEPESKRELAQYEERSESFDEEPSELFYYVAVRVSDTPEGREREDGLTEYEDSEGREYLFAPDLETAERAALASARESLWAFSLDFLAPYFESESLRSDSRALAALGKCAESLCEGFGPIVEALLGSRCEDALRAAIRADGLAHFLASYDSAQLEDEDGALRFRVA